MARLVLDAERAAVPLARHWASEGCAGEHLPASVMAILQLLVTEAVANAVEHGFGPISLELQCDATTRVVRVDVHDASPALPVLQHVGANATGGRGVALIDLMSDRWGTRSHSERSWGGKTVWFEVSRSTRWPEVSPWSSV